jgi:hypothetical protein
LQQGVKKLKPLVKGRESDKAAEPLVIGIRYVNKPDTSNQDYEGGFINRMKDKLARYLREQAS